VLRESECTAKNGSSGTKPHDPSSVKQEALRRLSESSYVALRTVACKVDETAIELFGTLPSHYLKQVAQTIAAEIQHGLQILNHIEVVGRAEAPSSLNTRDLE
jgi:hypothetical protein